MTNLIKPNSLFLLNKTSNEFSHGTLPPSDQLFKQLPAGIYKVVVTHTPMGTNHTFQVRDKFKIGSKIYGDTTKRIERIKNAYHNTDRNLGVILAGVSGAGKSYTAKILCNSMAEEGNVVLIIDSEAIGFVEKYTEMFQAHNQDVVFFIDEYEKMFISSGKEGDADNNNSEGKAAQNYLLSLLDGVVTSHNLFIFTLNDMSKVNDYFFNRPSRIRYLYQYTNLPLNVISEFIDNEVVNPEQRLDAKFIMVQSKLRTFDILQEFATECNNNPDESPADLIDGFNIENNSRDYDYTFDIQWFVERGNGKEPLDEVLGEILDSRISFRGDVTLTGLFNNDSSIDFNFIPRVRPSDYRRGSVAVDIIGRPEFLKDSIVGAFKFGDLSNPEQCLDEVIRYLKRNYSEEISRAGNLSNDEVTQQADKYVGPMKEELKLLFTSSNTFYISLKSILESKKFYSVNSAPANNAPASDNTGYTMDYTLNSANPAIKHVAKLTAQ